MPRISVTVTKPALQAVDYWKGLEGRTQSQMAAVLIEEALKARGK